MGPEPLDRRYNCGEFKQMRIQKTQSLSCFLTPKVWHRNSKNSLVPQPFNSTKTGTEVREWDGEGMRARWTQIREFWTILTQLTKTLGHLTCVKSFFWRKKWTWRRWTVICRVQDYKTWAIPFPKDNLYILQKEEKKQGIIDKAFISIHKNSYMPVYQLPIAAITNYSQT